MTKWEIANQVANDLADIPGRLEDAGLAALSDIAQGLLDRIEAGLEGDTPYKGDIPSHEAQK